MLKMTAPAPASSLPTLFTPRLKLYPLTHDIVVRQLTGKPFTLDLPELGPVEFDTEWPGDAFAIFASLAQDTQSSGGWVMVHAGKAAGMIGPKGVLWGAVEIGYGLRPQNWRQGLATEAVQAVTAWLLTLEHVRRVTAETAVDNLASAKVLTKAGFVETGRGHSEEDGDLRLWERRT
ncbi:GNAT family N-acetyltransferase [Deinococcus detaillensis]|uniref:GNAT family N-acetyltransferase n=2 Tax=Deinococcus detaillensis TaxID=2592048 RepID=A0A553UKW6_9DEIO|nr:GNAT family N-acetyltransferase [Deinococcus detaillensis]